MKKINLYTYMILFMGFFVLSNSYQDIFTVRIIEAVAITVFTAVILDSLIIFRHEGKLRFPKGALITGLIIAALVEPELENRAFYVLPPMFAILSKWLLRTTNRNIFNPAAFGLISMRLFYSVGIVTWWAATPAYLVILLGLFIVYKMKGWHLVLSFFIVSAPLYIIYGIRNQIDIVDSLGLINLFFAFFMLTDHKIAPMANKARILYGSFIGVLSFVFFVFLPDVENTLTALLIGNASVQIMSGLGKPHRDI